MPSGWDVADVIDAMLVFPIGTWMALASADRGSAAGIDVWSCLGLHDARRGFCCLRVDQWAPTKYIVFRKRVVEGSLRAIVAYGCLFVLGGRRLFADGQWLIAAVVGVNRWRCIAYRIGYLR